MKHMHLRTGWKHVVVSGMSAAAIALPMLALAEPAPVAASVPAVLEQATDVKAQPLLLLSKFPKAGPALARYVAEAISKQPDIIDAVLSILPDTSKEQASAMGAGVVRALRMLSAKKPSLVKEIVAKIERSDNVAFKTTFFAIGPRNPGKLERYEIIVPPANNLLVGQLGDSLPLKRGRLGVDEAGGRSYPNPIRADNGFFSHGMIVAIIASNAANNGAVPTSPIQ